MGYTRYLQAERLYEPGEVEGCGLALDARIGGEEDFLYAAVLEPREELLYLEVVGAYASIGI